ncbi:hypothetical protein [Sphingomonas sp.]|uniref:hypothetical protein n=1 Tax=Sphingomonas sp. TaxID=28214 RepID=UPI002DE4352B|nr:hypothetical protein [Sphingomonas sp.]
MMDRRSVIRLGAAGAILGTAGTALWSAFTPSATAGPDSSQDVQARIDAAAREGGGAVVLPRGATTHFRKGLIIKPKVRLDLNGGQLIFHLSQADDAGVRLRSGATIENGGVFVRSLGTPGIQGGAHAPILVGSLLDEAREVGRLWPNEDVSGWTIRGLVLGGDKNVAIPGGPMVGSPAIQIMGSAHNGLIEDIEVLDSAHIMGGVHLDWGVVGPLSSADIEASARAFAEGRGYTTHPHDIIIRRIKVGALARPLQQAHGTFGVRLSGVHDISVSDVEVEQVSEAAFYHTAGDLGFEFARPDAAARACRGIRFSNGLLRRSSSAYLVKSDSFADNIARQSAQGYRPRLDPLHSTDILLERMRGVEQGPGAPWGIRVDHQRGGRIVDCAVRGFGRGFYIDEQVYDLDLVRPVAIGSREFGISVEHPSRPPGRIRIDSPDVDGPGILIGRSDDVRLTGRGPSTERGGDCVVRVTRQAVRAQVEGWSGNQLCRS